MPASKDLDLIYAAGVGLSGYIKEVRHFHHRKRAMLVRVVEAIEEITIKNQITQTLTPILTLTTRATRRMLWESYTRIKPWDTPSSKASGTRDVKTRCAELISSDKKHTFASIMEKRVGTPHATGIALWKFVLASRTRRLVALGCQWDKLREARSRCIWPLGRHSPAAIPAAQGEVSM